MSQPEPAFSAPWHAQVFALTVHLNEAGHFTWPEWVEQFSATLKTHGLNKELNGGDDYFQAWLETLEKMVVTRDLSDGETIDALKGAWKDAYLATPHGHPVKLHP